MDKRFQEDNFGFIRVDHSSVDKICFRKLFIYFQNYENAFSSDHIELISNDHGRCH